MKYLYVIIYFTAFIYSTSAAPNWNFDGVLKFLIHKIEEVTEYCQGVTNATSDDIEALLEDKIPTTETGKCMLACEFMEYGIITEDKKYNKYGIFELLPVFIRHESSITRIKMLTEHCENSVKNIDDVCEMAAKIKLCFKNHVQEYGVKGLGFEELLQL